MNGPAGIAIRNGVGKALDGILKAFAGYTDIDFQAVDEDTGEYETIFTLQGKWLFEKTKQRPDIKMDAGRSSTYLLSVVDQAAISAAMITAMQTATHVLIDSKRYVINRNDSVPPSVMDPFWQIYCDHEFV